MQPQPTLCLFSAALLFLAACGGPPTAQRATEPMLADAGRSDYHIVIARAASPSVNYAAQELQHHFTRAAPSTSGCAKNQMLISNHVQEDASVILVNNLLEMLAELAKGK